MATFLKSIGVYYFIVEIHKVKKVMLEAPTPEEGEILVQSLSIWYWGFYSLYIVMQTYNFSEEILYSFSIQHDMIYDKIKYYTMLVAAIQDICMALVFLSILKFYYDRNTMRNSKDGSGSLSRISLPPRQRIMFSIIVFFGFFNLVASFFQAIKPLAMMLTDWVHVLLL